MDEQTQVAHRFVFESADEFRDASWKRAVFLGGLNLSLDDFVHVAEMARSLGDETAIVTDVETIPPHQFTAEIAWSHEALLRVWYGSILGHVDTHIFGLSRRWGGIALNDLNVLVVGSEQQVIGTLMDAAGGEAHLRDEFEAFMREMHPTQDTAVLWP